MERERITISVKKRVLDKIDRHIDGTKIRNRSHAFETLAMTALGESRAKNAIIMLGGDDAMKRIPATKLFLENLEKAGFSKAIVAVGFLGDKVKENLSENPTNDLSLEFFEKGQGSGGVINLLKNRLDNTFIIFNSTKPLKVDIDQLLNYHKEHNSVATIATFDLDTFEGVYIFEPVVCSFLPKGFSMIDEDLIPKLIENHQALIYPLSN
jgi:NDP-sugar pyrophosphorylase family protein